jgi:type IV conjugative transfer system pilin TraA
MLKLKSRYKGNASHICKFNNCEYLKLLITLYFQRSFKKINTLIIKFKSMPATMLCLILGYFYSISAYADSDELSGVMSSVKSNFGTDSTFIHLLYLAEVVVGVYTYHKTKNIPVLLGIVIISLFLNYALGHWVFTS